MWIKASGCDSGACVEVTLDGDRVLVRDSAGSTIEQRADYWAEHVLFRIRVGRLPEHVAEATAGEFVWAGVPPRVGGPVLLRFDPAEWLAFEAGVRAGEFDLRRLQAVTCG